MSAAMLDAMLYVANDVMSVPQQLQQSYKEIYRMWLCNNRTTITNIFHRLMGSVADIGAVIAHHVAASTVKKVTWKVSKWPACMICNHHYQL